MHDRRRFPRFDACWPAHAIQPDGTPLPGKAINVSASGLMLATARAYALGDLAEVCLSVDHATSVRCVVRIVRECPAAEGSFAYGVEIQSVAEEDRRLLKAALLALLRCRMSAETTAQAVVRAG